MDYSEGELRKVVNLTLSSWPTCIQWQDIVETTGDGSGCSGWSAVSLVPHCALCCTPQRFAGSALPPVEPLGVSSAQSAGASLRVLGVDIPRPKVHSRSLAGQSKPLPGVWPLPYTSSIRGAIRELGKGVGTK